MPKPPVITTLVPAADQSPASWHYTTTQPGEDWMKPGFDDSSWKVGSSGFGTPRTPHAVATTLWNSPDIWLRRDVEIAIPPTGEVRFWIYHDEDAEVYLNGVLALKVSGNTVNYTSLPLSEAAMAALKPGKNLVAVHCHQSVGGQYIDLGFISQK